jgi:tRNA-dihydrouridine synthase B
MDGNGKKNKMRRVPSRDQIAGTAPAPDGIGHQRGDPLGGVRVIVAPLCGVTDSVFRKICLDRGADLAVTEMISSEGLVRNSSHVRSVRHLNMSDGPLALQIFGADAEVMGEAAAILSELNPRYIDMNFGCPVRKIVNKNGGSAILKDTKHLVQICERVVEKSKVPVSAKIRAGWDKATEEDVSDLARVIEDTGVSTITVHARTKAQAFKGKANWLLIKAMKNAVSIPVVGNGDVIDAESYFRMREETGCDAVMIGRAAIGNPWVFKEIAAAIEGREYMPPSPRERVGALLDHVRLAVEYYGEFLGVISTRRMMAAYLKRFRNAREIRSKIMACDEFAALEVIMHDYVTEIEEFNNDAEGRAA